MVDPDSKPNPASPTSGKRIFLIACALVFGGYWLIAGHLPGIGQALTLFPFVVLAWLVIALYPRSHDQKADPLAATSSTDADVIIFIARFLADKLPAFSAYVLAPLVALACVFLIIKAPQAFFFFSSEGSAAGLFVPIIMWVLVFTGFLVAGVLYFRAIKQLKR